MTAAVDFINTLPNAHAFGAAIITAVIGAWVLTAWSAR